MALSVNSPGRQQLLRKQAVRHQLDMETWRTLLLGRFTKLVEYTLLSRWHCGKTCLAGLTSIVAQS
jgi:hypothetical protein